MATRVVFGAPPSAREMCLLSLASTCVPLSTGTPLYRLANLNEQSSKFYLFVYGKGVFFDPVDNLWKFVLELRESSKEILQVLNHYSVLPLSAH